MIALLCSIAYVGLTGLISFYTGAMLPRKWFHDDKFPFCTYKWEQGGKIYDKLKIRRWKGEILDMSKILTIILPKKLSVSATLIDVQSLIAETCVAEAVHWVLCVISIGNYWIWKKSAEGIVITVLCIIGNMPFILVQRYNRPHLKILREKMIKREKCKSEV